MAVLTVAIITDLFVYLLWVQTGYKGIFSIQAATSKKAR